MIGTSNTATACTGRVGHRANAAYNLFQDGIEIEALGAAGLTLLSLEGQARSVWFYLLGLSDSFVAQTGYGRHISAIFHRYREQDHKYFTKEMKG